MLLIFLLMISQQTEDTDVIFNIPSAFDVANASSVPIASVVSIGSNDLIAFDMIAFDVQAACDVSVAFDDQIAYDVQAACDVLVTFVDLIAFDVQAACDVQATCDVPLDVHITFNVDASNVTYQICPRRKRRTAPCDT